MTLSESDHAHYRHVGHLTVPQLFGAAEVDAVVADIQAWGEEFLAELPPERRAWYVDGGVTARTVLRKLDNPHFHRDAFQALARDRRLLDLVERFIGPGVSVYFSQIFFKPPEGAVRAPVAHHRSGDGLCASRLTRLRREAPWTPSTSPSTATRATSP